MSREDDIKKLITIHTNRLQKLKEQQASAGQRVDPSFLLEIEALEGELDSLRAESAELEDVRRSAPPPPAQEDDPTLISGAPLTPPASRPPVAPSGPPPAARSPIPPETKTARSNTLLWVLVGSALVILPLLCGLIVYFLFVDRAPSPGAAATPLQAAVQASPTPTDTRPVSAKETVTAEVNPLEPEVPTDTATPTEEPSSLTPTEPPPAATPTPTATATSAPRPTSSPTLTPIPTRMPSPAASSTPRPRPSPTPTSIIPRNEAVDMLMNRIPLVVHHATSFTCASGSGLNNLMDSVVAGHVIGPHTGDFVWTSRECSQIGNVLLRYTGDTFQLIREEPWLRFCNGEEFLPFEEALEMFAIGEIVWSGCLGCPGRGVPNCDLAAR